MREILFPFAAHRRVREYDRMIMTARIPAMMGYKDILYNLRIIHYDGLDGRQEIRQPEAQPPDISVIIPMYNERENASDTIRRVAAAIEQSGRTYEIIPVNDGSSDDTLSILNTIADSNTRVRVVSYGRNGGRGKALRYGLRSARGRYIATIDADLSYDPGYIVEMAGVLDEEHDIDMVLASPYMKGAGPKAFRATGSSYRAWETGYSSWPYPASSIRSPALSGAIATR